MKPRTKLTTDIENRLKRKTKNQDGRTLKKVSFRARKPRHLDKTFSFLDPKDVLSCKLGCKEWKSWVEQGFDHSYNRCLPLVFNCKRGNVIEVKRLLLDKRVDPSQ